MEEWGHISDNRSWQRSTLDEIIQDLKEMNFITHQKYFLDEEENFEENRLSFISSREV